MPDVTATLEELDRRQCLDLVATASVGRLAVLQLAGSPLVVPVNFTLDGDVVVFRTSLGTKYEALLHRPVSFEVDAIDPANRTGWSVLIQGIALTATDASPSVDVDPWAPGDRSISVRVIPSSITGRRVCTSVG